MQLYSCLFPICLPFPSSDGQFSLLPPPLLDFGCQWQQRSVPFLLTVKRECRHNGRSVNIHIDSWPRAMESPGFPHHTSLLSVLAVYMYVFFGWVQTKSSFFRYILISNMYIILRMYMNTAHICVFK